MTQDTYTCPKCGLETPVADILSSHGEQLRKHYADEADAEARKIANKAIAAKQAELEANAQEIANKKFAEQAAELKAQTKKELSAEMASKDEELKAKSAELKNYNHLRAEHEKLKRVMDEKASAAEADKEAAANERAVAARNEERAKHELAMKDMRDMLDEQKRITKELQRKQEQGSVQRQGETQELAIEEWLQEQFPADLIEEIKKGQRGADCLQTVRDSGQDCGTIYYESKRTKNFKSGWIEKFKEDMLEKSANVGVLVTSAMPSGMERFGQKDGIWVCTFEEFKGLCFALRESVISINRVKIAQVDKGDKAAMLYDYLTGDEFKSRVDAIVEGFSQMRNDIHAERRAMEKIWKKREHQIDKVIHNTARMHGSIQGIGGENIKAVSLLELSTDDSDE